MFRHAVVLRAKVSTEIKNKRTALGRAYRKHKAHESIDDAFKSMSFINESEAQAGRPSQGKLAAKRARKSEASLRRGRHIAMSVKSMSDGEWEAVPTNDKHAYCAFVAKQLKEAPTEISEQMRRRYFEATMVNPSKLDFTEVTDTYERMKLGLPVALHDPERKLGVTEAMYQAAEADLFNPKEAYKLENAMTHLKQLFVDYVRKKKEGVSTEGERRKLANLSAELNYQTQLHLATMFKFAERKIQDTILDEKRAQLRQIAAIADAVKGRKLPSGKDITPRQERIKRVLRDEYGVDLSVASTVLKEMRAQEDFMRKCEVFARVVFARGFEHNKEDEGIDTYVAYLRTLYSMDPSQLASIEATQFMAMKEDTVPVDWAKRWFEKTLLLPLQQTPEYKTLAELEARKGGAAGEDDAGEAEVPDVINIVDKMFVPPEDERLKDIHEKRLRYVAHLHMESQIKRMRANAKIFEGAERHHLAGHVRELYGQLLERKKVVESVIGGGRDSANSGAVFVDEKYSEMFAEIWNCINTITSDFQAESEADKRSQRLRKVLSVLKSGKMGAVAKEAHESLLVRKEALVGRLLGLMERDIREDMEWVENVQEAERPPLLPVPQPMSYVSAVEVQEWTESRGVQAKEEHNPFKKNKKGTFKASFLGQPWSIPDKPMLFWGTGTMAVQQALKHAAEDSERQRNGEPLAPQYPCPGNPYGWRVTEDILDV